METDSSESQQDKFNRDNDGTAQDRSYEDISTSEMMLEALVQFVNICSDLAHLCVIHERVLFSHNQNRI